MLALVSVLLGCTGDEINTLGTGCKRMMTFHVSTPYDNSPKTRIAYNDTKLELTWQTGDKLAVLGLFLFWRRRCNFRRFYRIGD